MKLQGGLTVFLSELYTFRVISSPFPRHQNAHLHQTPYLSKRKLQRQIIQHRFACDTLYYQDLIIDYL